MSRLVSLSITDNSREVLDALGDQIPIVLEEFGWVAEGYAKRVCPVDTGNLRNSITHDSDRKSTAYIGTNVEYAPYVEMGTSRTRAKPYLKPAIVDHIDTYKQVILKHLTS